MDEQRKTGLVNMEMPEKIRALLAKASNTPYEEEAASFFAKAQELMEKYAIDEESLWAGVHGAAEKPIVETMTFKGDSAQDKFALYTYIAKYNRCIAWKTRNPDGRTKTINMSVAGYPSDIVFISTLFTSMLLQMNVAMVMAMIDEGGDVSRTWKISFTQGYTYRLGQRMAEAYMARQTNSPGTELVLAREHKVKDFVTNDLGLSFTTSKAKRRNIDHDGYSSGRSAADKADLGMTSKLRGQRELHGKTT